MDVGKRYDRMLDEMEFLYQQRRDARSLLGELLDEKGVTHAAYGDLMTLLADREKEASRG